MPDNILAKCITRYVGNYYKYDLNDRMATTLRDSLSRGQLMSKLSATAMLKQHITNQSSAFFIGHWHGLLPMFFYESGIIKSGTGIELDKFWVDFSNEMNSYWNWKSTQGDASLHVDDADIIVNTSAEHMDDTWLTLIKPGKVICTQSTDYNHPTHVNSVNTLADFKDKLSDFTILDARAAKYDIYSRFTIIAIKN
jgi:hypothetical protein